MATTKHRILFIADSFAQSDDLARLNTVDRYPEVTFRYPLSIAHDKASITNLLKDCREVIREDDIDAVLTLHPANTLVQAVLLTEFKDLTLRGPSFEGTLMCIHKYYNKLKILNGFHLPFEKVEAEDKPIGDYINSLDKTGEPVHLVDALGTNESLMMKIRSDKKISMREIQTIRKSVTTNYDRFRELIKDYTDEGNHPDVFEPLCVVEDYWKNLEYSTFHLAEGCIEEDDTMINWALSDVVYDTGERKSLKYVSLPSILDENTMYNIWASLRSVSDKLIGFGFKQHFFHALIVSATRSSVVKIVDLNCGIIKENTVLYRHVLNQGDNLKGLIEVSVGNPVMPPKVLPNRFAMRAELRTYLDSGTVEECIDVKRAKSKEFNEEVELFVNHSDQAIEPDLEEGGMKLANVYLTGANKKECFTRMNAICTEIVRPDSKMNWKVQNNLKD